MKINFQVVEHKKQRYETVGDYFRDRHGTWQFRVSHLPDPRYEQLVFLHELTELTLVLAAGLAIEQVDDWDKAYEEARAAGQKIAPCGCKLKDEPGDDQHSPYHEAHKAATLAEKAAAKAMGVNWNEYDKAVMELDMQDE